MKTRKLQKKFMVVSVIFFLAGYITAQETDLAPENTVVHTMNDKDLQWGPCPDFMPQGCEITVLNGDPAKKNVDVFFKVPANSKIPNHTHTSAERMILVAGELDVTYEGERMQQLRTGTYAYGPAQKAHSATCGDAGPCVLFIAFEDPLDAFAVEE